ncbi:MAG TPA: phosphatidate cytidylyltransferase [Phnomibacter sp.]|nr:phosphatidate cytidylyltransferase [Phnomibacter sp.]
MALNKTVFKTRAISAVVFALLMLCGLLWNPWSFLLLFSIIHMGCWWEYFNLLEKIHGTVFPRLQRLGFMLMGFALMLSFCGPYYSLQGYGIRGNLVLPLSTAGFLLLAYSLLRSSHVLRPKAFAGAMAGILYISLSWGLMLSLRQMGFVYKGQMLYADFGYLLPLVLIASIWINDTMAYIVGSMIGRTPFSKISPKKTWEGTIGGAILAVVVVTAVAYFWLQTNWLQTAAVAATAAIVGTAGDLLESWLKRRAGVKDSGNMMPGHGGFLDRFDSMLLATPFVWLVVMLLQA